MIVDLSRIPENWFLDQLKDERTTIVFRDQKHSHIQWRVFLQHINGGRRCSAVGSTPQIAVNAAIVQAQRSWS